ncbi:hypothetical protein GM3709_1994 [Geminocystis sp. NIES-3709]|nr:hypothetical protein GM3709_1994 [Geminocystis sp. NIES-3709]
MLFMLANFLSGTLKNFGAKIASNTVRVTDLGKSHKNG